MNSGKLVALVLIAAVTLAAPAQIFPTMPRNSHPAGCHAPGRNMPKPQPASFQCCLAGHDAARLPELPGIRPAMLEVWRTADSELILPAGPDVKQVSDLIVASSPPPILSPLRL